MIQFAYMPMSAIGKLYFSRSDIERIIPKLVFNYWVPTIPGTIPDDLNILFK